MAIGSKHGGFMLRAIRQAQLALEAGELPFGAVVVQHGKVIANGRCRHVEQKTVLAHAELEAVHNACLYLNSTDLGSCTIYCTVEPCNMCAAAIFQAKIPQVVLALSRSDLPFLRKRTIGLTELAIDSGYHIGITRGVSKPEALPLFDAVPR